MSSYTPKQFHAGIELLKTHSVRETAKLLSTKKHPVSKSVVGRWKKSPIVEGKKYIKRPEYKAGHVEVSTGLKALGKTPKQISDIVGASVTTVRRWLKDPRGAITKYSVHKLEQALPGMSDAQKKKWEKMPSKIRKAQKLDPNKYKGLQWREDVNGSWEAYS